MKAPETWVVVADGARAKILRVDRPRRRLELMKEMSSAEARQKSSELMADRQGRALDSTSTGQRSAMDPPTDPQRHEKEKFVRQVAAQLTSGLNGGKFEKLLLVVAPQALGDLRAILDERVKAVVQDEIAKDLTLKNPRELAEHLGELLWP